MYLWNPEGDKWIRMTEVRKYVALCTISWIVWWLKQKNFIMIFYPIYYSNHTTIMVGLLEWKGVLNYYATLSHLRPKGSVWFECDVPHTTVIQFFWHATTSTGLGCNFPSECILQFQWYAEKITEPFGTNTKITTSYKAQNILISIIGLSWSASVRFTKFVLLKNYCFRTLNICDQIYQQGSYTHTVSSLTFHRHSTDTTID